MTFRQLRLLDKSDACFYEATAIFQKYGGPDEVCSTEIERAHLFADRREISIARTLVSRALDRAKRTNHRKLRGEGLRVRGLIELTAGEFDTARRAFEEAIPLAQEAGAKLLLAEVNEGLAMVLKHQGNRAGAARRAAVASRIYLQIGANARANLVLKRKGETTAAS
jgi:tetratricopeptide (TPR) repeat protein